MKKYAKLYNRVWAALHEDDAFVIASQLRYDEIVALLEQVIEAKRHGPVSRTSRELAEAVIDALTELP